jgi:hypothetical protein
MQPNDAAAQGKIADVPMIIGYNAAGAAASPLLKIETEVHFDSFILFSLLKHQC